MMAWYWKLLGWELYEVEMGMFFNRLRLRRWGRSEDLNAPAEFLHLVNGLENDGWVRLDRDMYWE